jgi:release factor glutamine methyltransferase
VGLTEFYGLSLVTAPGDVMIPRPATEDLVRAAVEWIGDRPARVVDVGTGSGAIAIAIASASPAAELWATDTSRFAVSLTRENVRRHGLGDRVIVRQGDLLDPVPGSVDLVVANLPYLPGREASSHPELALERHDAVFAGGDGLGLYRRLLAQCPERLAGDGGVLIQFRRQVLGARRIELPELLDELERRDDADIRAAA